jgi:hypothetical protein
MFIPRFCVPAGQAPMLLSPRGRAFRPVPRPTFDQTRRRRYCVLMPRRTSQSGKKPSGRNIYCGDCLDPLRKLPDGCVDRAYMWHRSPTGEPNSNRNYEVFRGDRAEPRPSALDTGCQGSGSSPQLAFEDRHASTATYIDSMRPRCTAPTLAKAYQRIGCAVWHALTGHRAALSFGSCLAVGCARGSSVWFLRNLPLVLRRDPHGN